MRIAFVIEDARIDGTVRFVARQARWLRCRGHEIRVYCADGPLRAGLGGDRAQVRLIPSLARDGAPSTPRERKAFRDEIAGWDAVIAVAGRAFPFAAAAQLAVPLYLDLLSSDLFVGDDPLAVDAVIAAASEGRIIAHSLDDARAHAARYGFDHRDVRYAALPIERTVEAGPVRRVEVAGGDIMVLSAARLDDDHVGYIRPLVDAVGNLRTCGYPLRLVVVGGGRHEADLRRDAPPYVTYLGPRHDLDDLYTLADVYVGEGSSRFEAALAGIAVISTCAQTHPSLSDRALLLFGMQQGTLQTYAPNSVVPPIALDDALALLLDDPELRRVAAMRGHERVSTEHAPERYVVWLEQLLAGRPLAQAQPNPPPLERTLVIAGGDAAEELRRAGESLDHDRSLGLRARADIPWRTYAGIDPHHWDLVADASRRAGFESLADDALTTTVR